MADQKWALNQPIIDHKDNFDTNFSSLQSLIMVSIYINGVWGISKPIQKKDSWGIKIGHT
jgi:hypothetical protein